METDVLPLPYGVWTCKLESDALVAAGAVLEAVKKSPIVVTHLVQRNEPVVKDSNENGIIAEKDVPLREHYQLVQDAEPSGGKGKAVYMHNKSLIEVAGPELTHKLYDSVQPLAQDVLVNYPLLYISNNPKSSSDVLIGGIGSWSPLHQDLPLYCTSVILVLEGVKEFAVLRDDVAAALRINITAAAWEQPTPYGGKTYPDLPSLLRATGGGVVQLRAGEMLVLPPRIFHFARNCSLTISCNFSVCGMEQVPHVVAKTLTWIEAKPQNTMHFDVDFARLLDDCTQAVLKRCRVSIENLNKATKRRKLPAVASILDKSSLLIEWYMTLQCIPQDWVQGFWGEVRDRLLSMVKSALPFHDATATTAAGGGSRGAGAAATAGKGEGAMAAAGPQAGVPPLRTSNGRVGGGGTGRGGSGGEGSLAGRTGTGVKGRKCRQPEPGPALVPAPGLGQGQGPGLVGVAVQVEEQQMLVPGGADVPMVGAGAGLSAVQEAAAPSAPRDGHRRKRARAGQGKQNYYSSNKI